MEQQSPPLMVTPQPYGYNNAGDTQSHTSIAPFVGIFLTVVVLGMIAVVVGWVCSGRRGTTGSEGYWEKYDMERWAERKCASCIHGRIRVNSPPPASSSSLNTSSEKDEVHSGTVVNTMTTANPSPEASRA